MRQIYIPDRRSRCFARKGHEIDTEVSRDIPDLSLESGCASLTVMSPPQAYLDRVCHGHPPNACNRFSNRSII